MLNNFKYIQNISEGVAEIRIYKRIGSTYEQDGVNGSDFANEMAYLQGNCKKINVRINSGGGNIIESYAIINSILNSKVPCDTYIDGIAASAAASIAVAGRKVYMVDYGVFMIHNASDPQDKAEQAILDIFNASINTLLTNRTGKTTEEITSMMSAETWLNAKECKECGMIDSIVSTEKKIKVTASTPDEYYSFYNELLTKKPNMKNLTTMLSLSNEATEVEIVKAIEAKDAVIVELTNKVAAFEAEKTAAIDAAKLALTNDVTAFANKLVTDKKIKEEEKAGVIANASTSKEMFDFVKATFEKVSNVKEPVKVFNAADTTNESTERAKWSFNDWSKKDPSGLAEMQNKTPEMFNKLVSEIPTEIKSKK